MPPSFPPPSQYGSTSYGSATPAYPERPRPDLSPPATRRLRRPHLRRYAAGPRRPSWLVRVLTPRWEGEPANQDELNARSRAELAVGFVLTMGALAFVLLALGSADTPTLVAAVAVLAATLVSAALNKLLPRTGVMLAGVLIVATWLAACMIGILFSSRVLTGGHLALIYLPTWDLLALAVIVAASLLGPAAAWVTAAINLALIFGDYALQTPVGEMAQLAHAEGPVPLLARHVIIQIVPAAFAYAWVRRFGTAEGGRFAAERDADDFAAQAEGMRAIDEVYQHFIQQLIVTYMRRRNGQPDVDGRPARLHFQLADPFPGASDEALDLYGIRLRSTIAQLNVRAAHVNNELADSDRASAELSRQFDSLMTRVRDRLLAFGKGRVPLQALNPVSTGTTGLQSVDELLAVVYSLLRRGADAAQDGRAPQSSGPVAPASPSWGGSFPAGSSANVPQGYASFPPQAYSGALRASELITPNTIEFRNQRAQDDFGSLSLPPEGERRP